MSRASWRFLPVVVFLALWTLSCAGISAVESDRYQKLLVGGTDPAGGLVCRIHHVKMEVQAVPIQDGFCVVNGIYAKARVRHFPNSFLSIASCFCEASVPPLLEDHLVCPLCRAAEERWSRRFVRRFDELRKEITDLLRGEG